MRCPTCKSQLSLNAVKCSCGWKADGVVVEFPCAHDGCTRPAILKRKVNKVMVNLCRHHDDFHTSMEAREFCKAKGLTTVEQMRDYCKANIPLIGRRKEAA